MNYGILHRRSGLLISNAFGPAPEGQIIWLDDVQCSGTENALEACSHGGFGYSNCEHSEDVSISCSTNITDVIGKYAERGAEKMQDRKYRTNNP